MRQRRAGVAFHLAVEPRVDHYQPTELRLLARHPRALQPGQRLQRLRDRVGGDETDLPSALDAAKSQLAKHDPAKVAIVLSAQHSLEDNFALVTLAKTYLGANNFFITGKRLGKADDILMSADKNPNTTGVVQLLAATGDAAGRRSAHRRLISRAFWFDRG